LTRVLVSIALVLSLLCAGSAQANDKKFDKPLEQALSAMKADTPVTLVYFSARDCRWCTYWEQGLFKESAGQKFMKSVASKQVRMVTVKKQALAVWHQPEEFPAEIAFVRDARLRDGRITDLKGYPWFSLYVGQTLVADSFEWDKDMLPAIEKVAARKAAIR
jgi:thioredoxin-related protein